MATAVFLIAAAVAIAGAFGVVLARDAIRSVLSLVLVMIALSVLFLLLSAQFLFAVQIIVYAGAVMVLFLFVIALMGPVRETADRRLPSQLLLSVAVVGVLALTLYGSLQGIRYAEPAGTDLALFGSVQDIAVGLFTRYLYPFELTSLILLVAAVGAIYLSRRDGGAR